jgi:hypothetical protein
MLRADEAVAIVQQLIHSVPASTDAGMEQPFGPPTLQNVYLDDEGSVTCRACQVTPAVAEMAIFLQQVLPPGTPKVPGALRYVIARALHEVDAPPFDSIQDFSAALERFEAGDRTAVVRALVERATAVGLDRLRASAVPDRRRLMPSSTDFRRELRAADARYYELASAAGRVVLTTPKAPPEQRHSPTLVAGILAGACLVCVGEVMHTRSTTALVPPPAAAPAVQRAQEIPVAEPDPIVVEDDDDPMPPVRIKKIAAPITTAALSADSPSKSGVKRVVRRPARAPASRTSAPASRPSPEKSRPGVMDRLHLGWLRSAFTIRHDPL